MIKAIRIYIEGDGDLRTGFNLFFRELREQARARRIHWDVILGGSREATYDKFRDAINTYPEAFNILLVDADGPVTTASRWEHLRKDRLGLGDEHAHLMVQMMEAWFLADVEALADYYQGGFNRNALPREANVERIEKTRIGTALRDATRNTRKQTYHKTRHAVDILKQLCPRRVRLASHHCNLFFTTIALLIDPPSPPAAGV